MVSEVFNYTQILGASAVSPYLVISTSTLSVCLSLIFASNDDDHDHVHCSVPGQQRQLATCKTALERSCNIGY